MKGEIDEQLAAGRRRGDALVQAIYAAALDELADAGFGRLTMEGIAERAHTGKMSLYRRWSSPQELVLDAMNNALIQSKTNTPDTGNLREDLITLLKNITVVMTGPMGLAMNVIIGERRRHPDLVAAVRSKVIEPHFQILQILERSVARGEIDADLITPEVCHAGPSMVIVRNLIQGSPPDDAELAAIVDRVVLPALGMRS